MTLWDEHEDDISDAISDSIDMDWSSRIGAKAVVAWLNENTAAPAAPQAEAGELAEAMSRLAEDAENEAGLGAGMLGGARIAADIRTVLSALRAQPQAREDEQPVEWRLLVQQQPKPGHKIVTLHDDGSGAALLFVYDGGVIDSDGDDYTKIGSPQTWWTYLPDGFEFACEDWLEDPVTLPEHKAPVRPAPDALRIAVEALEPFALLAPDEGVDGANMDDPLSKWFTVADLVAARQARLAALQAEQGAK